MNCPLCSNKVNFELVESRGNYKIFRCSECSIEFSEPMNPANSEFYHETEWYGERWEFLETLNFLKDRAKKILEVGCGEGYFLFLAIKHGFEVIGLDFNEKAIKVAKKKLPLCKIYPWTLEEFLRKFPEEKFDAICFFHLLEHLEDPVGFVSNIKKILNQGGFVIFSLPSTKRIEFFISGREKWDYPPHHLTRWNSIAVEKLFKITGLKNIYSKIEPLSVNRIHRITFSRIRLGALNRFLGTSEENQGGSDHLFKMHLISILVRIKTVLLFPLAYCYYLYYKIKGLSGQSILYIARVEE